MAMATFAANFLALFMPRVRAWPGSPSYPFDEKGFIHLASGRDMSLAATVHILRHWIVPPRNADWTGRFKREFGP